MNFQYAQIISTSIRQIERLTHTLGKSTAWLLLLMALIETVIVVLRYGFNEGSIALQESVTYLHATIFLLGAAYTLSEDGHVRVDIIYRNASARFQAWINLLGSVFFLLPFAIFLFWISLPYVTQSWTIMEASADAGGIPGVFILKTLIPIFCSLLFLQGLAEALKAVQTILRGTSEA